MSDKALGVEKKKVDLLLKKIVIAEKTNMRTKQWSDQEMVKKIMKMIEEEAECY